MDTRSRGGIARKPLFVFQQRRGFKGVKKLGTESCVRHEKNLILLALAQDITELLQGAPNELSLLPEVGGEEAVGVDDGNEGGLEGVLEGLGGAGGRGVGVLDTGELEQTLDGGGGNETSTTGSGDELYSALRGVYARSLKIWVIHTRTETEPHLPLCLTGRE